MAEIIRRFEPLTRRLSRKLTGCYELQQDLANSARFALTRAVRRHNPAIPGFAAYAVRFMNGAVLRTWKQPRSGTPMIEVVLTDFDAPESELLTQSCAPQGDFGPWGGGSVEAAVQGLGRDQQILLHARYVDDASLQAMARRRGTTVSAVSQRLSTAHRAVARGLAA